MNSANASSERFDGESGKGVRAAAAAEENSRALRSAYAMPPCASTNSSTRPVFIFFLQLLAEARPLFEVFLEESLVDYDGAIAGKVRSVRTVAPFLKLLDSRVEQESYLQLLTRRLGVSEDVLRQELGLVGAPETEWGRRPAEERDDTRVPAMEEVVTRILVHYPSGIPLLAEAGVLDEFEGQDWRELGRLLEKHYRIGGILDLGGY